MPWQLGLLFFFGILLLLLVIRLPVAFAMGLIGTGAMVLFWGGAKGLILIANATLTSTANFMLAAIPGFIIMAEILMFTGITDKAFAAINKIFGRTRGGLAYTTIVTTTFFGAVTGFSPASCAAVGSIAIPAMMKQGYRKTLAIGVVGGGAALAILIPPSILMILYGFLAEVSVGRLFFAGIIPGLVSSATFMAYVAFLSIKDPRGVPRGEEISTKIEQLRGLVHLLPIAFLIFMVLGVIYLGIATPTEAAAIGGIGTIILAIMNRSLNWPNLKGALYRTARLTGMIFAIIVGAKIYGQALTFLGYAGELSRLATDLPLPPIFIVMSTQVLVLILGMFLDPMSIIFITIPVFAPVIAALGFDPLWFGIIMLINIEVATLTPPFGLNLFVLRAIVPKEVTWGDIIRGCAPFVGLHLSTMALVMIFPQLVFFLPNTMMGK